MTQEEYENLKVGDVVHIAKSSLEFDKNGLIETIKLSVRSKNDYGAIYGYVQGVLFTQETRFHRDRCYVSQEDAHLNVVKQEINTIRLQIFNLTERLRKLEDSLITPGLEEGY